MAAEELARLAVRPETVSQQAYVAVRDAIVDQTLPSSRPISEADLARQLGVSKTPVREALLRLQEVGLVEHDGNRGLRVVQRSRKVIIQAYEARWALECAVARLAALRATSGQFTELKHAAEQSLSFAQAGDITNFRHWDYIFHQSVAASAVSPRLAELADNAYALSAVLRARDVPFTGDSVECAMQHVEMADAIGGGDEVAAYSRAGKHVETILQAILTATSSDEESGEGKLHSLHFISYPLPKTLGDSENRESNLRI